MKYLVTEIKTTHEGQVTDVTSVYDEKLQAESAYYLALAGAAQSTYALHTVILYMNDGTLIKSDHYEHSAVVPAPAPTQS